eukprot:m.183389 g.183389  ORF g.183389 m.183389 type:complete len:253 (-) comp14993_c0_seq16:3395-4153(-)
MLLGRVMHAVGAAGAVGGAMMLASKVTECSVDGNVPVHIGKWIDGWSKGRTSFHKNDVNPTLQKYVHTILPASSILVPLCGKTLDLGWLAAQDGVDVVVGTEAVEQAMLELEREPGSILGFQKIPAGDANRPLRFAAWAGAVMKPGNKSTSVGRVHILEGDHFVLDQVDLPPHRGTSPQMPGSARVSAVWDRASLVAVRPQDRSRCVSPLVSYCGVDAKSTVNSTATLKCTSVFLPRRVKFFCPLCRTTKMP